MASAATPAKSGQPLVDRQVLYEDVAPVFGINGKPGKVLAPSTYVRRPNASQANNSTSLDGPGQPLGTKAFNWENIERNPREAKENGISRRRGNQALQEEITNSLLEEAQESRKGKEAAEKVRRSDHASAVSPDNNAKKRVHESPDWGPVYEEDYFSIRNPESQAKGRAKTKHDARRQKTRQHRKEKRKIGALAQSPLSSPAPELRPPVLQPLRSSFIVKLPLPIKLKATTNTAHFESNSKEPTRVAIPVASGKKSTTNQQDRQPIVTCRPLPSNNPPAEDQPFTDLSQNIPRETAASGTYLGLDGASDQRPIANLLPSEIVKPRQPEDSSACLGAKGTKTISSAATTTMDGNQLKDKNDNTVLEQAQSASKPPSKHHADEGEFHHQQTPVRNTPFTQRLRNAYLKNAMPPTTSLAADAPGKMRTVYKDGMGRRVDENLPEDLASKERLKAAQAQRVVAVIDRCHPRPFKLVVEIKWPAWCKKLDTEPTASHKEDKPMTVEQDLEDLQSATQTPEDTLQLPTSTVMPPSTLMPHTPDVANPNPGLPGSSPATQADEPAARPASVAPEVIAVQEASQNAAGAPRMDSMPTQSTQSPFAPTPTTAENRLPSDRQNPDGIICYWHLPNVSGEHKVFTAKKRCCLCKTRFRDFGGLRDHLKSSENHSDVSVTIIYSQRRKVCDIWIRWPEVGQPAFSAKLFKEVFPVDPTPWDWLRTARESSVSIPSTPVIPPMVVSGGSEQVPNSTKTKVPAYLTASIEKKAPTTLPASDDDFGLPAPSTRAQLSPFSHNLGDSSHIAPLDGAPPDAPLSAAGASTTALAKHVDMSVDTQSSTKQAIQRISDSLIQRDDVQAPATAQAIMCHTSAERHADGVVDKPIGLTSTGVNRAPHLALAEADQRLHANTTTEAPRLSTPMTQVVLTTEPVADAGSQTPVSPVFEREMSPENAHLTVPTARSGSIIHDSGTRLRLTPSESLPQYPPNDSMRVQTRIDLTHEDQGLSDADKDFIVVWDLLIMAKEGRGATNGWMFNTVKAFVLANWTWLHQRQSRVGCFYKHITVLKATRKLTPEAARMAALLLNPPTVPRAAWDRVERDCVWTEKSLHDNQKHWTALWDSLRWQWERNRELTPAIHTTLEQFINVAGHLLIERDQRKTLETRIRHILRMMQSATDETADDQGTLKFREMTAPVVIQYLHDQAKRVVDDGYHDFEEALDAIVADMPGDPESVDAGDVMRKLLQRHPLEFMDDDGWKWRRYFEVELHLFHITDGIILEALLTQLANLRAFGSTTDPEAPLDAHPLVVQPPVIKPAMLPSLPPVGQRLPIPKPAVLRGMMECKCGVDVVEPSNVVYCSNRDSKSRKCPHPAYHYLCVDAPRRSRDGRRNEEAWFCEECKKKGWDGREPTVIYDGTARLEARDGGGRYPGQTSSKPGNGRGRASGQNRAAPTRETSPNPQPQKKQKKALSKEAEIARDLILADDATSTASLAGVATPVPEVVAAAPGTFGNPSDAKQVAQSTAQEVPREPKRSAVDDLASPSTHKRVRHDLEHEEDVSAIEGSAAANIPLAQTAAPPTVSSQATSSKRPGGPCTKCGVTKTKRWSRSLPFQGRPGDGRVWCKNCYTKHYTKIEKPGGPCLICHQTRSKRWYSKLQDGEQQPDGTLFCHNCWPLDKKAKKAIKKANKMTQTAQAGLPIPPIPEAAPVPEQQFYAPEVDKSSSFVATATTEIPPADTTPRADAVPVEAPLPELKPGDKWGGPCHDCETTSSKAWHKKLTHEPRPGNGSAWCSRCYQSDRSRKQSAVWRQAREITGRGAASADHAPPRPPRQEVPRDHAVPPEPAVVEEIDNVRAELDKAQDTFFDLRAAEAPQGIMDKQDALVTALRARYKQLQAEAREAQGLGD